MLRDINREMRRGSVENFNLSKWKGYKISRWFHGGWKERCSTMLWPQNKRMHMKFHTTVRADQINLRTTLQAEGQRRQRGRGWEYGGTRKRGWRRRRRKT